MVSSLWFNIVLRLGGPILPNWFKFSYFHFKAEDSVEAFQTCIDATRFNGLDDCNEECAPTFAMLASSEMPTTFEYDNFGAGSGIASDKPLSSICDA